VNVAAALLPPKNKDPPPRLADREQSHLRERDVMIPPTLDTGLHQTGGRQKSQSLLWRVAAMNGNHDHPGIAGAD